MVKTCVVTVGLSLAFGISGHARTAIAPPDLSGHWVLVSAPLAKSTRTGSEKQAEGTPTAKMIDTVGGAAFNCGAGCLISQKGNQLTIDQAMLSTDNGRAIPAVTIVTDGKAAPVQDSFNPKLSLNVTATWKADVLTIASERGRTINQEVSLKGGKLVVVSQLPYAGIQPMTFTYEKR
jgi:hypothetical protein